MTQALKLSIDIEVENINKNSGEVSVTFTVINSSAVDEFLADQARIDFLQRNDRTGGRLTFTRDELDGNQILTIARQITSATFTDAAYMDLVHKLNAFVISHTDNSQTWQDIIMVAGYVSDQAIPMPEIKGEEAMNFLLSSQPTASTLASNYRP
jgi:hypothetical protein